MKFFHIIFLSYVTAKRSSGRLKSSNYLLLGEMGEEIGQDMEKMGSEIHEEIGQEMQNMRIEMGKDFTPVDETPLSNYIGPFISTRGARGEKLTPVDENHLSTYIGPFISTTGAAGEKLTPVDENHLSIYIGPFISTTGAAGEKLTPVDETPLLTTGFSGVTASLLSINGYTGTLSRFPPSSSSLSTDDLLLMLPTIDSSAIRASQYTLPSINGFTGTLSRLPPSSSSSSTDDLLLMLPTIDSSAITASQYTLPSINGFRHSATSVTDLPIITPSETFPLSTNPSNPPISAPASTLSTSAKVGIGIGAFLGLLIMILPSILLWRSKRKDQTSKRNPASPSGGQFTKAELDAEESQISDRRRRELPGVLAHELAVDREEGNETWELPGGDLAHELTGDGDAHEAEAETKTETDTTGLAELPGDMTYDLREGKETGTEVHDGLAE